MGEKERAEALLQAAGVTGVAVAESPEVVTMSKAEADALRAAAAASAPPPAPEIPAAAVPAAVAAATAAQGPQPPAGKAPLESIDAWEKLPEKEQLARMGEVDQLLREGAK